MKRVQLVFWVAVATLIFSLFPAVSSAVSYGGVSGQPAYPQPNNPRTNSIFIYQLKGGQQTTDGLKLLNDTKQQQVISVQAVDSVISSGGAFACAQAADQKKDVGSWVTLQQNTVTLAAGSSQIVPFIVSVPPNAYVGEHDGCVTIQAQSETAKPTNKNGVALSFRSAIRVVITVPGKIVKKLTITSVDVNRAKGGDYVVVPTVYNYGNVSLDTDVHTKMISALGASAGSAGGTYPVLPHVSSSWNFTLKRPFWGGWYHAQATVTYNSNPTAELGVNQGNSQTEQLSSAVFFAPPTLIAGLIEALIVLGVLAALGWYIRKQRDIRLIRKSWQDYTVGSDEDINDVAKHYQTSWKRLARVNRIKPPYNLRKGQKLKVPPRRKG